MDSLHGLGSKAHILQDFCVGVRVLQSFSLELYGGERAVDLGELLLQALLSLQGLQSSCYTKTVEVTHACLFLKTFQTCPPVEQRWEFTYDKNLTGFLSLHGKVYFF